MNLPNSNLEEPSALFNMFWEAENALNCVLSSRRSGLFTMVKKDIMCCNEKKLFFNTGFSFLKKAILVFQSHTFF